MIDSVDFEKLRKLPCESVAMRMGFVVKQHKSLCCFHDDHKPSMTFKGSHFKCWSCGAHGDTLDLVMRYLNKNFLDACRWLADENNIILTEYKPEEDRPPKPFDASRYERFFEHPWLNDEAQKFLLKERMLDERVVRWCRLTSWKNKQGVPWLQIPYFSREGELTGVQNRNLVKGAEPRFRFVQGLKPGLWNLPVLNRLRSGDELYIAEGVTDGLALLSSAKKTVAIPSATMLNKKVEEQLLMINSQFSVTFHIYPDADLPGTALANQLKQVLPDLVCHQLPEGCKDYSDYYLKLRVKN